MKHTAREIELCRELAMLWRMPIGEGDYTYNPHSMAPELNWDHVTEPYDGSFPLPGLSDILQEIRRRGWYIVCLADKSHGSFIRVNYERNDGGPVDYEGATDLECAISCLIKIIRKEKWCE